MHGCGILRASLWQFAKPELAPISGEGPALARRPSSLPFPEPLRVVLLTACAVFLFLSSPLDRWQQSRAYAGGGPKPSKEDLCHAPPAHYIFLIRCWSQLVARCTPAAVAGVRLMAPPPRPRATTSLCGWQPRPPPQSTANLVHSASTQCSLTLFSRTSGAMYCGVPHMVCARRCGDSLLANPKSVSLRYPFPPISTFSGCAHGRGGGAGACFCCLRVGRQG